MCSFCQLFLAEFIQEIKHAVMRVLRIASPFVRLTSWRLYVQVMGHICDDLVCSSFQYQIVFVLLLLEMRQT